MPTFFENEIDCIKNFFAIEYIIQVHASYIVNIILLTIQIFICIYIKIKFSVQKCAIHF